MIYYNREEFWRILFAVSGSVFPRVFLRSLCAAIIATGGSVLWYYGYLTLSNDVVADFYSFSGLVIGLLLGFRMDAAFSAWLQGVNSMSQIQVAARNIVSSIAWYMEGNDAISNTMKRNMRRLLILACVLTMKEVRRDPTYDDLLESGLLREAEVKIFKAERWTYKQGNPPTYESVSNIPLPPKTVRQSRKSMASLRDSILPKAITTGMPPYARPSIVLAFLRGEIQLAVKRKLLPDYFSFNIDDQISIMAEHLGSLTRISYTPVPISYSQLIKVVITFYVFTNPVAMVSTLQWAAPFCAFILGLIMFGIDECAVEIEDPFGTDANDIDLERQIRMMDEETACMLAIRMGIPIRHFGLFFDGREGVQRNNPTVDPYHSVNVEHDDMETEVVMTNTDEDLLGQQNMTAPRVPPKLHYEFSHHHLNVAASPMSDVANSYREFDPGADAWSKKKPHSRRSEKEMHSDSEGGSSADEEKGNWKLRESEVVVSDGEIVHRDSIPIRSAFAKSGSTKDHGNVHFQSSSED